MISTYAGNGSAGSAGDGGPATAAQLYLPRGLAMDGTGNLYISQIQGCQCIRKVNTSGIITTIGGGGSSTAEGIPATDAYLNNAQGVAVDGAGNVYVALIGLGERRIRKISPSGIITTIAGAGVCGYSGDGGPATGAALCNPVDVTTDAVGNIYIADQNNHRIRKINATGIITTIAGSTVGYSGDGGPATLAQLQYATGVAVDAAGNVYIADRLNNRIRKVNTTGIITTIAGTGVAGHSGDGAAATLAQLNGPNRVLVDGMGNVFISDGNFYIRKINAAGIITTIAGTGTAGYTADTCIATAAMVNAPTGIAIDGTGNLYFADGNNDRVRKIGNGYTPLFTHGHSQHINICDIGATATIDTNLAVLDMDNMQPETWTVVRPPAHGTLAASYSATSIGGTITPTGLTYTPASGYSGNDTFKVRVADCVPVADTTTVYVTIANCALTSPQSSPQVERGLVQVYPTPTNNELIIEMDKKGAYGSYTITNSAGQVLLQQQIAATQTKVDVKMLPAGLYYIVLKGEYGSVVKKFVKM